MELQEHLDENPELREWYEAMTGENPELREWYEAMTGEMDRLTATGFPNVVPGVMDADVGITHRAYLEEIEELVTRRIWDTDDDKDVNLGEIQSFDEWKRERRENVTEHIEFSYCTCDLCGTSIGGSRHYVTALPTDPSTNDNYVSYTVCDNCYFYVCNGDLPEF